MDRLRQEHRRECRQEQTFKDEEGHEQRLVSYTKPFKTWLRARGLNNDEATPKAERIVRVGRPN